MKKATKLWGMAACLSACVGILLSGCTSSSPTGAGASSALVTAKQVGGPSGQPQWGLQVASVNSVPDTQSSAFQETFKLINFATVAQDASEVFAAVYFDVPQGNPNQVSFVNSTFASVFNPNGTPTGVNSSVVLDGVGLFGPCLNPAGQTITSDFGFTFETGTMVPPNGGYITFTPELWRSGYYPFNDNNDWTAQSGNTSFHFDPHIDLIFNGLGNVTDACVYSAPGVQETVIGRCNLQPENCSTQVP